MSFQATTRLSQPSNAPRINTSNPLTKGLVYANTLADDNAYDAARGKFGTPTALTRTVNPRNGKATQFTAANSSGIVLPTANLHNGTTTTVACYVYYDSSNAGGTVYYSLNGSTYNAILGNINGDILVDTISGQVTGLSSFCGFRPSGLTTGIHHLICSHRTGSIGAMLWIDGKYEPISSAPGTSWANPAAGNHSIGYRLNGSTPRYHQGLISDLLVWNRELTYQEIFEVYSNTNQVYVNTPTPFFVNLPEVTASPPASGSLAATESGSDTAAFTGNSGAYGSLAATESGADTASISGVTLVVGSLAATESGADTASISGATLVVGSLAATESGADTAAFTGSQSNIGILAATETGSDTASLSGVATVAGSLAVSESGSDTAVFSGVVFVVGSMAASGGGADTAAFTGSQTNIGILSATETGSDTASINGSTLVQGTVAATESGSDTASFAGIVFVSGSLAAVESGADVAAFFGSFTYSYVPSLRTMVSPDRASTFMLSPSRTATPFSSLSRTYECVSPSRSSAFVESPSRTVPTLNSITRSVTFISPARTILLSSSPSRTISWSSPERSEVV